MYKCKYFNIKELVSPGTYNARGEKAWQLLDDRLLWTLDELRKKYGPMTINDWSWGGQREWSGLRTPDSPYYSQYSQHSYGRASDIIFKNISAEEVRQHILANSEDPTYKYINAMELGVSWCHLDIRNCDRILAFYP